MTIQHFDNIIIPSFEAMREELELPKDQKCLLIYDVSKAQITDKYREHFEKSNIAYVQVPPNLTHIFQLVDLNVNEFAKLSLKLRFQDSFRKKVIHGLNKGENVHQIDIDAKISKMKPIHARWLISLYNKFWRNGKIGFRKCLLIMETIDNKEVPDEDPFKHLFEQKHIL